MALLASLSLVLCLVADRIEALIVLLALGGIGAFVFPLVIAGLLHLDVSWCAAALLP